MRLILTIALLAALLPAFAHGRVGESESELATRFGDPVGKAQTFVHIEGIVVELGQERIYRQGDWKVTCELIEGKCAEISYCKMGEWAPEQLDAVLATNAQGSRWKDVSPPGLEKVRREWLRQDGATAGWAAGTGLTIRLPAFEQAKAAARIRAKNAARETPNF